MPVGRSTVLRDANVMHPAIVRGTLLRFAASRLFRPLWSEAIPADREESLRRRFPDLAVDHFQRQRACMDSFGAALVAGYEPPMPALALPDPKDVHVLAAAIHGRADAIGSQRRQFRNPAVPAEEYLDRFRKSGPVQPSHRLQPLAELF